MRPEESESGRKAGDTRGKLGGQAESTSAVSVDGGVGRTPT